MNDKKLIKNSLIYVLLGFLSPAINFILIPIYSNYISPKQYGIITFATLFQAILINIIGIGLAGSFQRFYFDYENDRDYRNKLFDTCIYVNIISTIIISIILYFSGDDLFRYFFESNEFTMSKYGWWIIFTSLSGTLQTLILSEFRNQEKAGTYSKISAIFFIISVIGILSGVVILKLGALGSIIGRSVGTTLPIFIYLIHIYSKRPFKTNLSITHSLLNYGYPIMIYSLLTFLYTQSDKIIIAKYFDSTTLGLYGFAVSIAMVTEILIASMNNTFKPRIYKLMKDVNNPKTNYKIKQLYLSIFKVMFFAIITLIAFSLPAIHIFINKSYHKTIIWMPLLFISYISRIYYIIYAVPVFYYKKTGIMTIITIITLCITILISILLIPFWGIFALIAVSFFANSIQVLSVIIYSRKHGIFNETLYDFENIHLLFSGLIALVLLGYFLNYAVFSEQVLLFMIYFILLWLVFLFYTCITNFNKIADIKKLIFKKIKCNTIFL